jgi:hypothetical protein
MVESPNIESRLCRMENLQFFSPDYVVQAMSYVKLQIFESRLCRAFESRLLLSRLWYGIVDICARSGGQQQLMCYQQGNHKHFIGWIYRIFIFCFQKNYELGQSVLNKNDPKSERCPLNTLKIENWKFYPILRISFRLRIVPI